MNKSLVFYLLTLAILLGIKYSSAQGVTNNGAVIHIQEGLYFDLGGEQNDFINKNTTAENLGTIYLDGNIFVKGNWINHKTSGDLFTSANALGSVVFHGNTVQTIGGTHETNFEQLVIDNPYGIHLEQNTKVTDLLELMNGLVTLSDHDLIISDWAIIASGDLSQHFIVTNGTGQLKKGFSNSGASFIFPIGNIVDDQYQYTPVNLDLSSADFSTGSYIGARVSNTRLSQNNSVNDYLNRYWTLEQSGLTNIEYGAVFSYLDDDISGDEEKIFGARYSGSEFEINEQANTTENELIFTALSEFSEFTGVDGYPPQVVSLSPGNNATGLMLNTALNIDFTEDIFKANGSFEIYKQNDNSLVSSIDVDNTLVSVENTTLNIDNTLFNLEAGTGYYINIDESIVTDNMNNGFEGITGSSQWSFATNYAPEIAEIPDQSIEEGNAFDNIMLDDYVTDQETNDEDISWSVNELINLSVNIVNRVATITPVDEEWTGSETVVFVAEDEAGLTASESVVYTIYDASNLPPSVSDIPDQSVYLGSAFTDINLNDYVSDDNTSDDNIVWQTNTLTNLSITITEGIANIAVLDDEWTGIETVSFTATDDDGLFASDDASFEVLPVAVDEFNLQDQVKLFPNPSQGIFFLEFGDMATNLLYKIYNSSGTCILTDKIEQWQNYAGKNRTQINLSDNAQGIYYLIVYHNSGTANFKIIVEQ